MGHIDNTKTSLSRKVFFRVQLSCGHWIKTRNPPFDHRTTYGCVQGMGCGYQLNWTETTDLDGSRRRENNAQ